jgi:hypothetical protein
MSRKGAVVTTQMTFLLFGTILKTIWNSRLDDFLETGAGVRRLTGREEKQSSAN